MLVCVCMWGLLSAVKNKRKLFIGEAKARKYSSRNKNDTKILKHHSLENMMTAT